MIHFGIRNSVNVPEETCKILSTINNFSDQVATTIIKAYNDQTKLGCKHLLVGRLNYTYDKATKHCITLLNPN